MVLSGGLFSVRNTLPQVDFRSSCCLPPPTPALRSCCLLGLETSWAPLPDGNASVVSFAHVVAQDQVGQMSAARRI